MKPRGRMERVVCCQACGFVVCRCGEPKKVVTPGVCRVCGCTDLLPCNLDEGVPCIWMDAEHTLCDNIQCLARVPIGELEQMVIATKEV